MCSPSHEYLRNNQTPPFDESIWNDERHQVAIAEFIDGFLKAREREGTCGVDNTIQFPPLPDSRGRMLSERDLAERFQVTPRTIRRWEAIGDLPPSVTYGGLKRWRAEDVEWWAEHRVREAEQRREAEARPPGS